MKSSQIGSFTKFLPAFLLVFIASCASAPVAVTVPTEIKMEPPQIVGKIPLRAGLYISPYLRTLKIPAAGVLPSGVPAQSFSIFMGDALVANMEKVTRDIFQDVVMFDATGSGDRKYDVTVTPELVKVNNDLDMTNPFPPTLLVETTLKWTIINTDGKEVYLNTIKSDVIKTRRRFCEKTQTDGLAQSLQDILQKSRNDIYASGWWKTNR